ncbi:hypothetical protein KQI84_12000 [bacterium]|nr:hypothetical protein [bacterium]
MKKLLMLASIVFAMFAPVPSMAGGPPTSAFTYQAQLTQSGVPVNGAVDLQFQVWDSDTGGFTISSIVTIDDHAVSNGLLNVELDFGTAPFVSTDRTWLEIGIRSAAETGSYTILTPRREILTTPRSLYAATAASVEGGINDADADPANEYNTGFSLSGSVLQLTDGGGTLSADLAPLLATAGDAYSLDAYDGSPADAVLVDVGGRVGVGTSAPTAQLHVVQDSLPVNPAEVGFMHEYETFTNFIDPTDVIVDGTLAYVADGSVQIIDVSDPSDPQLVSAMDSSTLEFQGLGDAWKLAIDGTTLYVSGGYGNTFSLVDVTDPANPQMIGTATNGENGIDSLGIPQGFDIVGNLVYVACAGADALTILDFTNPAAPIQVGKAVSNGVSFTELDGAWDVTVVGNLAYVVSANSNSFTVIDVTNPASPTESSVHIGGQNGFPDIGGPRALIIDGSTAYMCGHHKFGIVDITNPASPTTLSLIEDDGTNFTRMSDIRRFFLRDGMAFLPALGSNTVNVIDVSDPSNPSTIAQLRDGVPGSEHLNSPYSVFADDQRIYVTSVGDDALTIYESQTTKSLIAQGDAVVTGGTGSVELLIEADTDNNGESDQPSIRFSQDGEFIQAKLGFFDARNNFRIVTEGATLTNIVMLPQDNYVGINTISPSYPIHVGTDTTNGNGAHVTAGGIWTNGSSREWKTNFQTLDPAEILDRLSKVPILSWEFDKASDGTHIGPTAEDFYAAFGLGNDKQYIATTDADGVALAAIQGLNQKLEDRDAEIDRLNEKLERLEALVDQLSKEVAK